MRWIALVLACASCSTSPGTDNFGRPFARWVPGDVRAFVIDAQACGHFSGEEAYDAERKAFLDRMVAKTCTGLDKRKAELSHQYAASAGVRELIDKVWTP